MRKGLKCTVIAVTVSTSLTSIGVCHAKNKAVEMIKYLNPVPEKSYLNKSQDRIIKKKGFKSIDIQGAKPVDNKELGLFAILPLDKVNEAEFVQKLLARQDLSGISVTLPWRLLEPAEGETKFKQIDDLLAACKQNGKTLILRVSTCGVDEKARSDTPDWVFKDPAVKSIVYSDANGNEHQMPVFWDTNYLAKWSNLINELGEQYDKNPTIHSIGITGGGVGGGTNVVPDGVVAIKQTIGAQPDEKIKEEPQATIAEPEKSDSKIDAPDTSSDSSAGKAGAKTDSGAGAGAKSESRDELRNDAGFNPAATADTSTGKPETAEAGSSKSGTVSGAEANDKAAEHGGKDSRKLITSALEKNYQMSHRKLIEHWKYAADLFPKAFEVTRLTFDISPPTPNRKGQDSLDEIADYLVYRYGQRVYLSRPIKDGRHGFDDYRLLLKFHPDTLTGYRLQPGFGIKDMEKLAKNAAVDGISFCEVPVELLESGEPACKTALEKMRQHMGYQLVSQSVSIPKDIKLGQKLTASFTFVNLGAAGALRPSRQLDKDVASSYKVQLELRNEKGAPIARLLHTPEIPTNQWAAGKAISWQEDLKMPPQLAPGKYDVYLSVLDVDTKRKLRFLNAIGAGDPTPGFDAAIGKLEVVR